MRREKLEVQAKLSPFATFTATITTTCSTCNKALTQHSTDEQLVVSPNAKSIQDYLNGEYGTARNLDADNMYSCVQCGLQPVPACTVIRSPGQTVCATPKA